MTINDVCPGMSKLPPVDQALELLSRTCGDLRLALLSKQMLRKDRDQVERGLRHVSLAREILMAAAGVDKSNLQQSVGTTAPAVPSEAA
jgi:F420-0:gamma-glutamyl ligase